jgi:fibronectin-binding autotransporter adhesin
MTFAIAPGPAGADSVVMTATTATDALSPPVQYYFENTTTSNNSGWISGTAWTDTGLSSLTVYGYRVKARDTAGNETGWSAVANAMTPGWATTSLFWDGGTAHIAGNGNGASQGGSGTWNTAIQNWDLGADYPHVAWYNPNNDTAVFGGTAGTVTLGTNITVGGLTFTAPYTLTGGTVTFGAPGTISNPANVMIASALAGTGPIIKSGSGTLTLSGTNTFSGGLVINGGALNTTAPTDANLGAAGGLVTLNVSQTWWLGNTYARPFTLNNGATLTFNNNGSTTISGAVTGNGGVTAQRSGAGGVNMSLTSTANTFTGPVILDAARTMTFSVNSLSDVPGAGNIIIRGNSNEEGAFVWGTGAITSLVLNNRQIELGNNSTANSAIYNNNATAANTITINTDLLVTGTGATRPLVLGGTNPGNNTFAGKVTDGTGAVISFTKAGAGTWVVSGTNTYTGATTVSGGMLFINGNQSAATGAVAVNGGTLGGTGIIGGTVTVAAAGSVAPGTSAGTLSIGGGLNVSAMANGGSGKLRFELGPIGSSDKLAVTGTLTIGTGVLAFNDFVFSALAGLHDGTYKLITSGAPVSGTLAGSGLSGAIGAGTGTLQISDGGTGNDLELVVTGLGGASAYDTWAGGAAFDADTNGDGVSNGMAWLLGATDKDVSALGKLPTVSQSGGGLVLEFDCLSAANRGTAVLNVQHSNDLGQLDLWADALVPGTAPDTVTVSGVDFVTTANGALIHVVATIPAGNAAAGKLFGRLNATYTP